MRVRMRTTAAGPWGVISAGKVGTVPDHIGRAMIAARAAEEVLDETSPTGPIAPPVAPVQTATAEPPETGITIDPPRRRRSKHAQVQEPGVLAGHGR
jgi:hypothetical protein